MELLARLLDKALYTAGSRRVVVERHDKEPSCATIPNNECQALFNSTSRYSVVLSACMAVARMLCGTCSMAAETGALCMWQLSAYKASSRGLV